MNRTTGVAGLGGRPMNPVGAEHLGGSPLSNMVMAHVVDEDELAELECAGVNAGCPKSRNPRQYRDVCLGASKGCEFRDRRLYQEGDN